MGVVNDAVSFIIDLKLFPFRILFSFGQTDEELKTELTNYIVDEKIIGDDWGYNGANARCFFHKDGYTVVRMRGVPQTPEEYNWLVHETFHATNAILDHIGIELVDESEEVFAYTLGFITEEVLTKLEDHNMGNLKQKYIDAEGAMVEDNIDNKNTELRDQREKLNKYKQGIKVDLEKEEKYILEKIKDLRFEGDHPNNYDIGHREEGHSVSELKVGEPLWVFGYGGKSFQTSEVKEIISITDFVTTFDTLNSRYYLIKLS